MWKELHTRKRLSPKCGKINTYNVERFYNSFNFYPQNKKNIL